jgi:4-hydroxybutyrate CoA-transferase
MPFTYGVSINLKDCNYIVEQEEEILELVMGRAGATEEKIAGIIAEFIDDGATLQLGIGGLPDFVLSLLTDKKDLGIHTEIFGDGIVDLYERGVITNARKNIDVGKIVSCCMFGGKRMGKFAHHNKDLRIMPVDYTNDPYVIAKNDNVISINACVEVDLLGQVNADTIKGKPYSGVGGQVDFVRGARMSKGGMSFLAMPSMTAKGSISKIVPHLANGSPTTTSRFDVDYIVTEYGAVRLWGKTIKERAKALISIAHPNFRDELEKSAFEAGWLK